MAKRKLDPCKMKDWEIAEAAEPGMKPLYELAAEMGLKESEIIPMGRQIGKVDFERAIERLAPVHLVLAPLAERRHERSGGSKRRSCSHRLKAFDDHSPFASRIDPARGT